MSELRFGDQVENIAASHDNPIKRGLFVRVHDGLAEYVTESGHHRTPPDNIRLSANRQETSPVGWRDIASAPKDGTTIDLWCINISHGSTGAVRIADAFWDHEVSKWEDRHGWVMEQKWRPTHWMPSPEAPGSPKNLIEELGEDNEGLDQGRV